MRQDQNKVRRVLRRSVLDFGCGKCKRCGFADWRALQLDHVFGGGTKKGMTLTTNKKAVAAAIRQIHIGQLQVLCANCNWIKRHERREFPHGARGYRRAIP